MQLGLHGAGIVPVLSQTANLPVKISQNSYKNGGFDNKPTHNRLSAFTTVPIQS
jgi:hypothetical protein